MPDEFLMVDAGSEVNGVPVSNPKVIGLAYGGGKISLPGWKHPVVVDLAGLMIPETVPLLANHENRTTARVGMVRARLVDNTLEIEGEILATTDLAANIVRQAREGADWQLSIGAEVKASELIRAGTSRPVNGRMVEGPFFLIANSLLREVSVVAVGADGDTRMRVVAQFVLLGGPSMDNAKDTEFDQWLREVGIQAEGLATAAREKLHLAFDAERAAKTPAVPPLGPTPAPLPTPPAPPQKPPVVATAALAAPAPTPDTIAASAGLAAVPVIDAQGVAEEAVKRERDRISAIQAVCDGEYQDIEREAIRANWSAEQAGQEILRRLRANRPQADARVTAFAATRKPDTAQSIEAALCMRCGLEGEELTAHYGEAVVDAAHRDRRISLQELFGRCLSMEGHYFRSFDNDAIRAAFSSVSLPGILSNVANRKLLRAYESQPIIATRLCREGDLANFNEAERYRLTDVGDLEPIAADGTLKHGGMREEKASNQLETWGKIFTLTRKMIVNDDLGAFMAIPAGLGAKAARKIDILFFQRLLKNPNSLFSDKHKNLLSGTDSVLSAESLGNATQMFLDQTDADGQSINNQPKFLLVPTGLRIAARELLNSVTFTAVGGPDLKTRIPTYNALQDDGLEVISSAYLSNKNYTGWSAKSWYLFGDPAVTDTFEIGYLRGQRHPTVEKTSVDFEELGMKFRVFFDLGVREQDHRGMVKSVGQ